jgi:flagellin
MHLLQEGKKMGLRIATNVQSLTAQRNLSDSVAQGAASMEKLSSGYRINRASDDAAGLAISEQLKADIRGLNMAKRNANDGISLVQTAEGGLSEIGNILTRLRELGVQSASDTIGNRERGFLNKEFNALKDEITRIATSTEFNGTLLLAGDRSDVPEELSNRSNAFPIDIQVGKNFFESVDGADARKPVNVIRINLEDINATVSDSGLALGASDDDSGANVGTKESSQQALAVLDNAISKVAEHRSTLGSLQSRLASTVNNLSIQTENASAANSRIRDTDFAEETAKFTQANILKSSGVSILSQANSIPQSALELIR